jgi:hypothetical protein
MSEVHSTSPVEYLEIPGHPAYRIGSDLSAWTRTPIGGGPVRRPRDEWRRLREYLRPETREPVVRLRIDGQYRRFTPARLWAFASGQAGVTLEMGRSGFRVKDIDPTKFDPLRVAWAAGLFDGEGSISIILHRPAKKPPYHYLNVSVTNTCVPALEAIRSIFGYGCVSRRNRIEGRRAVFTWATGAHAAEVFLRAILPYAVIKRPQIELALEYRSLRQNGPFQKRPDSHFDRACEIAAAIRRLNGADRRKDSDGRLLATD